MTESRLTIAFTLFLAMGAMGTEASPIHVDTVVDASSPHSGNRIEIENGLSGPTIVTIVEGGIAAGVIIRQSSSVVIDGGNITLPSRLEGSSQMVLLSGSVACSDDSCHDSDPAYLVQLSGVSSIEVRGGFIDALQIVLLDDSTADFFGTNLMISQVSTDEYAVTGSLADGTPLNATVAIGSNPTARITLHQVPEPNCCILAVLGIISIGCRRTYCYAANQR